MIPYNFNKEPQDPILILRPLHYSVAQAVTGEHCTIIIVLESPPSESSARLLRGEA